jgi:Big-like domain-containing protein
MAIFLAGSSAAADDSTPLSATITVAPPSAAPNANVTITATVTPGTNPDSTGIAVTCDLSWAGLNKSSSLSPDASGLVFSRTVTVPSDAVPGQRMSSCTVTDDQGRSSSSPYSVTITSPETDAPPTVTSQTPADGATDVAVDANIGITFSEAVDLADGWYTISCGTSGTHTAAVTGGGSTYVLDPDSDFANAETCTVSLDSTKVTDAGGNALDGTVTWSFTTVAAAANLPPTVQANGPYTVAEGGSVSLGATGADPEGGALTYAWDLDNNGTYETSGSTVTFSAAALDGASSRTVGVQVTDSGGATATDTATVDVTNVAPTATFTAPATAFAGLPFTLSLTSPQDPSIADTNAGFTYSYDCGDGTYAPTATCTPADVGTLTVHGQIADKDGGSTAYTATVSVTVTFDSLCTLVRAYSTDPKVADDLCAKLATAATASASTAHDGALGSFRNQVDAKVGKGLTAAQAAQLKLLSTQL